MRLPITSKLGRVALLALSLPVCLMSAAADAGLSEAERRGLEIFEEVHRRMSGYDDLTVDLTMILRSAGGDASERELSISQLEVPNDGDKILVVFESPRPIEGTALLSFSHALSPDDQWLYLPALKRVKKIAARNKSGPFLSSEFSFEDLTPEEIEEFGYKYLRDESLDGVPCFVVERYPRDESSGYTRQVVWIDKAEHRTRRIDYYDRKESLLKTLHIDDYRLYADRFWRAGHMFMKNHQTGKSTELYWRDYEFATGLSADRDFSINSLRRAR